MAIFSVKAAALAVGERRQLQKFCAEFFASQSAGSRRKSQKNGVKVFAERLGCASREPKTIIQKARIRIPLLSAK